jgi:nitrate/TMAO reductase-like tetraheme cytochrome c subunit
MRALAVWVAIGGLGCRVHAEPPPPAPTLDLISPLAAAGVATTSGNDWGPVGAQPSREVFDNVALLGELSADRVMVGMQSMAGNLGVGCDHCHDAVAFSADTLGPKLTARTMMQTTLAIDAQYFGGEARVTCYTCHRGQAIPDPAATAAVTWPLPADTVYTRLELVPAAQVPAVMTSMSAALGVECAYCHVPDRWADDDRAPKRRAREMMTMAAAIETSCVTCHHGSPSPARDAGPSVIATVSETEPRAILVVAEGDVAPATRGELRVLVEAGLGRPTATYRQREADLGHYAPGPYTLCTVMVPEDDTLGAARPVACAPFDVPRGGATVRVTAP